MRFPVNRLRPSLIALSLLLAASAGSATPFQIHSDSEEQRTGNLAAQLEQAKSLQSAAFDTHRTYLAEAITQERSLIIQRAIAQRDRQVALIMSAPARGGDPSTLLRSEIAQAWKHLTGSAGNRGVLQRFRNAHADIVPRQAQIAGLIYDRDLFIAQFQSRGGKGKFCDDSGAGDPIFDTGAGSPEAIGIADSCEALRDAIDAREREYLNAGPYAGLLGDPKAAPVDGAFAPALAEYQALGALISAQKHIAQAANGALKELEAYYLCQSKQTGAAASVREDAAAVQAALNRLAALTAAADLDIPALKTELATLFRQPVASKCDGAAAASRPEDSSPDRIAETLSAATKVLDHLGATEALLGAIRANALDTQASLLGKALDGLALPATTPTTDLGKTELLAFRALRLFDNLDVANRAANGELPDVSGILVAIADARMQQASARIEADRLIELQRLAHMRVLALAHQARALAEASTALEAAPKGPIEPALLRFVDSWNEGAIPAAVLSNAIDRSRLIPWLDRERAVVDAGYAVLAPAASQFQAYGKSGISPDTIARFFQAVGLGGIAVSK